MPLAVMPLRHCAAVPLFLPFSLSGIRRKPVAGFTIYLLNCKCEEYYI